MATSHSASDYLKFSAQHLYVSALVTIGLLAYVYWDIVELRFFSGFFRSAPSNSQSEEYFISGLTNNLTTHFYDFLPIIIISVLTCMVAFTLYNAYKNTVHYINVNHNYVNVKKTSTSHIALHYTVLYTIAFVIPLQFWCFYFISWFPNIAKLPIKYIFEASTAQFWLVTSLVVLSLVLLTHFGLVLTKIMVKLAVKE